MLPIDMDFNIYQEYIIYLRDAGKEMLPSGATAGVLKSSCGSAMSGIIVRTI